MIDATSETRTEASKRRKTDTSPILTDNSLCVSKSSASKRKPRGKVIKAKAMDCCETEEKNRGHVEATAVDGAGPKRLQAPDTFDNCGHRADSVFFEGDTSNPVGLKDDAVSPANASMTEAKMFIESSGADLSLL